MKYKRLLYVFSTLRFIIASYFSYYVNHIIIIIIRGYSTTTTHFGRSIPRSYNFLFDDAWFLFFQETSDFGDFAEILVGFPRG